MRILVLAPQWPDPPRQGAAIRNLHVLLRLARSHSISLLTFQPDGPVAVERLEPLCERVEILPLPARNPLTRLRALVVSPLPDMAWRLYSPAMAALVRELHAERAFDAIHIEGIEMARYALELGDSGGSAPRVTYDAHNAEHVLQRRAFTTDIVQPPRFGRAIYSLLQWWRLRRFERDLCAKSEHVIAVSKPDATALARLTPTVAEKCTIVPNGVDPAHWSRNEVKPAQAVPRGSDALVFDGSMDFRPNIDAAGWMAREVMPLIREERPLVRLYIVGRNPTPEVQALQGLSGVVVTGAVDDPREWVAAASVYVVPMRMGGGVRLKLLQAMAMGCAIVSTPMGAEGVAVHDGVAMLLARNPGNFASAVVSLLTDRARGAALGAAAARVAAERYAWDRVLPALDAVYV